MERFITERELVDASKVKFSETLKSLLSKLNPKIPVSLIPSGAEGPLIIFKQDEENVLFLAVYRGDRTDYRDEFISQASEILKESNFKIA